MRGKTLLKITVSLFLVASAIYLLFILVIGSTSRISKGTFGPFTIGQSKAEAIASLESINLWPAQPTVYARKHLENPSYAELKEAFADDSGVPIWVGGAAGVPLRIEFEDDLIARIWPNPRIDNSNNQHEEVRIQYREYVRLGKVLEAGISRDRAFEILSAFPDDMRRTVSNFVVGAQHYREMNFNRQAIDPAEYTAFMLTTDAWTFTGLKDEVWYSSWVEPYYSRITLYFKGGNLERMSHTYGALELP